MLNMPARSLLICSFAFCLASASHASELYTFEYTALSGPVESFSFSLTAPAFVTAGSSPLFTPFTLTDGTNNWTMTKDLVDLLDPSGLNRGCFQFGTPFAGLSTGVPPFGGPCSFIIGGPGTDQAALEFDTSDGLPTAPGSYKPVDFSGAFDTPAGFEFIEPITDTFNPTGTMMLTITEVPEASSLGLTLIGLSLLGGGLVREKWIALHKRYAGPG
jgi:hypothetical protein